MTQPAPKACRACSGNEKKGLTDHQRMILQDIHAGLSCIADAGERVVDLAPDEEKLVTLGETIRLLADAGAFRLEFFPETGPGGVFHDPDKATEPKAEDAAPNPPDQWAGYPCVSCKKFIFLNVSGEPVNLCPHSKFMPPVDCEIVAEWAQQGKDQEEPIL